MMTITLLRLLILLSAFILIYLYSCGMIAMHFAGVDAPRRSRILFLLRLFSSHTCFHFADCPEPGPHNIDVKHDAEVVATILNEANRVRAQKKADDQAKELRESLKIVQSDSRLESLNQSFVNKAQAELDAIAQSDVPIIPPRPLRTKSKLGKAKNA